MSKYQLDLLVPSYMTDNGKRLRPSAFLELAQEVAYLGADQLGFGYDVLAEHNVAWVLSRMHVHYDKAPVWKDRLVLNTWHKGQNRLFFDRDFHLVDQNGESMVRGTSSWLIINTETRRLARNETVETLFGEGPQDTDNAIGEPCPKITFPKGVEPEKVAEHRVAYSDVDMIGHANNTRYLDWAMDCIEDEITYGRTIKDAYLNYNKEATPGEVVEIYRYRDGDSWYFEGRFNGTSIFTALICF